MRTRFHAAIQQYGEADFEVIELFEYPTREEACDAEIALIAALELMTVGYNSALGGDLPPNHTGHKRSDAHKAAIAEANRRRVPNRERIRAAAVRRNQNPEYRAALVDRMRSYAADPTMRASAAAKLTGQVVSAETRAKISAIHKGRPKSAKTRAKMAEAGRAAWARRKSGIATDMVNV